MSHSQTTPTAQLDRGLTLSHTISLVVGTVIGTGVFLKATVMAQTVGSPSLVLWAWVLAGLLSMAGALTYAELGGLLPRAGGEYAYLLEAYGEGTAFLYGWMRFVMGSAGSIAILLDLGCHEVEVSDEIVEAFLNSFALPILPMRAHSQVGAALDAELERAIRHQCSLWLVFSYGLACRRSRKAARRDARVHRESSGTQKSRGWPRR